MQRDSQSGKCKSPCIRAETEIDLETSDHYVVGSRVVPCVLRSHDVSIVKLTVSHPALELEVVGVATSCIMSSFCYLATFTYLAGV